LLKAGPGFQYILKIVTVADSVDVNGGQLRFADADADTTLGCRHRPKIPGSTHF